MNNVECGMRNEQRHHEPYELQEFILWLVLGKNLEQIRMSPGTIKNHTAISYINSIY